MWVDELLRFSLKPSVDFPETKVATHLGMTTHLDHLQGLVILVTMGTHNLHCSWLLGSKGYIPKESMYGMCTFHLHYIYH